MKEFFFLNGKDPNGPFTLEQLTDKGLTSETLIWAEGMEKWQYLKDIPEFTGLVKPKSVPPPPPIEAEKTIKTEISGQINLNTKKVKNPIRIPKWLIIWCAFHLFALLFSYSGLKHFNQNACLGGASHETNEFWPISDVLRFDANETWCGYSDVRYFDNYVMFNGFFYNYDLTEFAFYIGMILFIFLLFRNSKKQ